MSPMGTLAIPRCTPEGTRRVSLTLLGLERGEVLAEIPLFTSPEHVPGFRRFPRGDTERLALGGRLYEIRPR